MRGFVFQDEDRSSESSDIKMDSSADSSSCSHDMTLTMTSSSTSNGPIVDNHQTQQAAKKPNETVMKPTRLNKKIPLSPPLAAKSPHHEDSSAAAATDISEAELSEYWDQVRRTRLGKVNTLE